MRTPFAVGKLTSGSAEIVIVEEKEKAPGRPSGASRKGELEQTPSRSLLRTLLRARAPRAWESGAAH